MNYINLWTKRPKDCWWQNEQSSLLQNCSIWLLYLISAQLTLIWQECFHFHLVKIGTYRVTEQGKHQDKISLRTNMLILMTRLVGSCEIKILGWHSLALLAISLIIQSYDFLNVLILVFLNKLKDNETIMLSHFRGDNNSLDLTMKLFKHSALKDHKI